jgi:hypothetical protein
LVHDDWDPESGSQVVFKRYTPDFVVHYADGHVAVVECKPERHLDEFEEEYKDVLKELPFLGLEFRKYSSAAAKSVRVENLKFLYPYTLCEPNLDLREQLLKLVGKVKHVTIAGAIDSLSDRVASLRELYALMFEGYIDFDSEKRVTQQTEIWPGNREHKHAIPA